MARQPIARPRVDVTIPDRRPRLTGERQEEMYIVQGEEAEAEYLVRHEEMPDVRSAEPGAGGAIAFRIERARIGAELGALDVQPPIPREGGAIPPHARGCDAVEQIDAAPNPLDQVFRKADSHQVARMGLGKRFVDDF